MDLFPKKNKKSSGSVSSCKINKNQIKKLQIPWTFSHKKKSIKKIYDLKKFIVKYYSMNKEQKKISTRAAFGDALLDFGDEFENIVTVNADLSGSVKTKSFGEKFPDRNFNLGISEQNMIGFSCGLSIAGKIPFACSFAIFSTGRPWEQIRQSVAYANLNVKIVGTHAGIMTGEDGATHQALEDIAIMRPIPNIKIFSPTDYFETKEIVRFLIKDKSPAYLRLLRKATPVIFDENYSFEEGKGIILKDGNDVAIFSHGATSSNALESAKIIEKEKGISVQVVHFGSLCPIDENLIIESAKKCKKIFVVEDHSIIGGLGSIVCEILSEKYPTVVKRHGMKSFGESGKTEDLYEKYGFTAKGIAEKIFDFFSF